MDDEEEQTLEEHEEGQGQEEDDAANYESPNESHPSSDFGEKRTNDTANEDASSNGGPSLLS